MSESDPSLAGWTMLVESSAVGIAEVVSVDTHDVVVWRAADGTVVVMDSRCPHQWSHLGALGAVDGCEIVCLSHHWRFGVDGTGSKLNVGGRRDPKSDATTFESAEHEGSIWADLGKRAS